MMDSWDFLLLALSLFQFLVMSLLPLVALVIFFSYLYRIMKILMKKTFNPSKGGIM